jgi:hypothetical protein
MKDWKPASKIDLVALEDRLPPSKKIVTAWLPGVGAVYKIVHTGHKRNFRRRPPVVY